MKLKKRSHRILSDRPACFRRALAGSETRGLLLIGLLIGFVGWMSSVSGIIESGALLSDGIWAMYTNPFVILSGYPKSLSRRTILSMCVSSRHSVRSFGLCRSPVIRSTVTISSAAPVP